MTRHGNSAQTFRSCRSLLRTARRTSQHTGLLARRCSRQHVHGNQLQMCCLIMRYCCAHRSDADCNGIGVP